jgi:hypothetical protein
MRCSKCGNESTTGRKFCATCRVAARCPAAVRSAEQKTLPRPRFVKTVAPRSRLTRHLPLPGHLTLHQRLLRFALRQKSRMLR